MSTSRKTALITGGTSGLGQAIATGFAEAGYRVFVCSRDAEKVAAAVAELQLIDPESGGFAANVADPASAQEAVRLTVEASGSLNALVNAAGITRRAPAIDMSLEDWNDVMDINLTGTFLMCQAAARVMREQGKGAIVNVASLSSYMGWALVASYGASKAAVVELTQTLGVEWAPLGIRVNAVAPGVFPTPLNRAMVEGTARGRWFLHHTPMGRFGEPKELVGAVKFLCSDEASYITGTTLAVDGGYLACGVTSAPEV